MMATSLRSAADPSISLALTLLGDAARHVFVTLLVLGSMMLVVGVVSALAQGGFYLSPKLVKPDPKKLDPIKGAKRLFGPHAAWEGVKVLGKSTVVGFLAWGAVKSMMPLVGGLLPIGVVLHQVTAEVSHLLLTVAVAGLTISGGKAPLGAGLFVMRRCSRLPPCRSILGSVVLCALAFNLVFLWQ